MKTVIISLIVLIFTVPAQSAKSQQFFKNSPPSVNSCSLCEERIKLTGCSKLHAEGGQKIQLADSDIQTVDPSKGSDIQTVDPSKGSSIQTIHPAEGTDILTIDPSEGSSVQLDDTYEETDVLTIDPAEGTDIQEIMP